MPKRAKAELHSGNWLSLFLGNESRGNRCAKVEEDLENGMGKKF